MEDCLVITNSVELLRLYASCIVYAVSDGNYCTIFQNDGESHFVTLQLGQLEKLIAQQMRHDADRFIRIGKCLIVNRDYIYYIHLSKQVLELLAPSGKKYSITASRDALRQLKELIENKITCKK